MQTNVNTKYFTFCIVLVFLCLCQQKNSQIYSSLLHLLPHNVKQCAHYAIILSSLSQIETLNTCFEDHLNVQLKMFTAKKKWMYLPKNTMYYVKDNQVPKKKRARLYKLEVKISENISLSGFVEKRKLIWSTVNVSCMQPPCDYAITHTSEKL